jgi:hypothetical protein
MAATGNSCLLADLKKSSLLKPLGQMNPNLVGSIYGMLLPLKSHKLVSFFLTTAY